MNRMILGAVAILVAGDVSAMSPESAISAMGSSQSAVNVFPIENTQGTGASVVSHEKKRGEQVMGFFKTSGRILKASYRISKTFGYVVLAGGSLVLLSAPYASGAYALGLYKVLTYAGVGALKSGLVAAVSTSLAANCSSRCYESGKKGLIKSINYFKGKKH